MELAVNTFTKGLQTDTHPMILGNDVMTDCLNGTLITMNGNEVILLNDMGNRRVDNAFLPSGYLPVGMKEYGGIIYVAAYNPITNKSQIGSFPSPLKKINSLNNDELGGKFDFDQFFDTRNVYRDSDLGQIKVINSDSFMIPLTKDTSLRAGDKFVVYSAELSNYKNNISNYDNTTTLNGIKYVISPKNKKYTLLLGILNSQNEFVDITKTLQRWDNGGNSSELKSYDSTYSDLYKFNDGYFIAKSYLPKQLETTIDDTKLIIQRQAIPANTYSYKLIGPLYLKVNLNHILNFNYNVYGVKGDENQGTSTEIYIEGFLTYNCPDGIEDSEGNSIGEYLHSGEDKINSFYSFDLYLLSNNTVSTKFSGEIIGESSNVYNIESNQYSVKIVKKYDIGRKYTGMFNYVLGINADTLCDNLTYIKGLSSKGSINIDLLGSGLLEFNGWKFYNNFNERNTTLTFSFEAYPKYGLEFNNLRFVFRNINGNDNEEDHLFPKKDDIPLPLYNGRQTYTFDWDDIGLNPRKVYEVTTQYQILNKTTKEVIKEGDKEIVEINDHNRWLLTTELFNEFYPSSAGISDFSTTRNLEFLDKMKVYLKGEGGIQNNNIIEDENFTGGLTSREYNIAYSCKHNISLNINVNPELKIIDENLYPDYIYIKEGHNKDIEIESVNIYKIGGENSNYQNCDSVFKSLLSKKGELSNDSLIRSFDELEMLNLSINNTSNKISGNITYYDRYLGYSETELTDVENVFDQVEKLIVNTGPKNGFYGCIQVNFDSREGHRDEHIVDVYRYQSNTPDYTEMCTAGLRFKGLPSDSGIWDGAYRAYSDNSDSTLTILFRNHSDEIYSHFNSGLYDGQMFMFMFPSDAIWYSNTTDWAGLNLRTGKNYAKVWWRTSEGEWALFTEMILSNETFSNYIKNKFSKNYIYCMYDVHLGPLTGIYATDTNNIYYDKYSIPLILSINYKTKLQNISQILNIDKEIGNLIFSGNNTDLLSDFIKFNLNSSVQFLDSVNSFSTTSVSNIDICTGLTLDSKGRKLNPNYIYHISSDNTQLIRNDDTYMLVDFDNKTESGQNTITYNRKTLGTPNYRYEHTGNDSDDHTILDYQLTNIVLGI